MRYFFRVEYDGSHYGGWQRQNNAVSIQEILEKAFATTTRQAVKITGAGRTDAGVHARGQGAHFDFDGELQDVKKYEMSANSLLPSDIAVQNLQVVPGDFHARFSAVSRRYRYYICERKRPLLYKRAWMMFYSIDWDLVQKNCTALLGKHDFSAFCASGCGTDNMVCNVTDAKVEQEGELKVFTIEADRFIYKMVRSVMGTLIDVGRGRLIDSVDKIIESGERARVGSTAPPFGLVLDKVTYTGVD